MQSNDNYVTVEIFNAGIARLEAMNEKNMAIIDGKLTEIRSEIQVTNSRIDSTNTRIDNIAERIEDLKFFGTVGLAIIAIFIAIVALVPIFRKEKTEMKPEQKSSPTFEEVNNIVEIAISKALAGISR